MPQSDFEKFKRRVADESSALAELFRRVAMGEFPDEAEYGFSKGDALSEVHASFLSMTGSLRAIIAENDQKKKEIERLVRQRTEQLANLNVQLTKDIAEQQIMEEALRESEAQYRLLAESAHDFIFIVDCKFNVRYVNEFGAKALRLPRLDVIGKKLDALFPGKTGLRFENAVAKVFESARPYSMEGKTLFPGGVETWLETKLIPIRSEGPHFDRLLGISRDISERKKAQEAVIERERFYSNIFSSILDGISILDKNLNIVQVNPFMEKWYAAFMPLAGKKCYEVYHQANGPCEICPTLETFKTGRAAHAVVPKRLKNGEICGWTDLHTFPLKDGATGEVSGVIENIRDITEQKKVEHDLRQSEELFRSLAETASVGIFIIKKSKFCYVNPYIVKTSGYSARELYSMDFLDLVHPEFIGTINARYEARKRGEPLSPQIELKGLKKNGEPLWFLLSSSLIDYEGEQAMLSTIIDISERKKTDNALAAEKDRLDVTLSSIGDSVISTDTAGKVVTINKMAETLTGYSKIEAQGRSIDDICRVIDDKTNKPYDKIFGKMIERHGIARDKTVCTIISRNDSLYLVDLSVAPIRIKDGTAIGLVVVFRDISEKQKLETELFKARKLESLGVLAGGIAHDFNNILTGVITNLFMVKLSLPVGGEGHKMLIDAEKACFRASRLTKQLLTFSKGGAPVKEICSIKELIEETVGFCLSGSNAGFRLDLPDDLLAANVDKGQIDQVLNNLLINAQQAMPMGGTVVVTAENVEIVRDRSPDQRLVRLAEGRYVKVSIKDEGVGIPETDLEKIFDPYFTTKPSGNGLGLTTSYSILKNHGGTIVVDSQVGRGSVFSFYLPAIDSVAQDSEEAVEPGQSGHGNVLVMDDDEAVRNVVSRLLSNYGYTARCTASGKETIEAYTEAFQAGGPFDVVIMDLTIPGGMGGKEVVKVLSDIDPKVKAIVSSGYSNDPIMANFRDYGFKGVIVKPFNIEDFVRVVEGVIRENA
jgi:PAS domain S-box-containing protein